jgi:hypothetical protein
MIPCPKLDAALVRNFPHILLHRPKRIAKEINFCTTFLLSFSFLCCAFFVVFSQFLITFCHSSGTFIFPISLQFLLTRARICKRLMKPENRGIDSWASKTFPNSGSVLSLYSILTLAALAVTQLHNIILK